MEILLLLMLPENVNLKLFTEEGESKRKQSWQDSVPAENVESQQGLLSVFCLFQWQLKESGLIICFKEGETSVDLAV